MVYRIRAAWCFQVGTSLACEIGQKKSFCTTSCAECPYYRRASGKATNVRVITSDKDLIEALGSGNDALFLRFARNAYEASAVISAFRPAFVVVDEEAIANGQPDLLDSLMADPRLPGVRLILGVPKGGISRTRIPLERGVVDVIEKSFGIGRILETLNRFPVEPMPPANVAKRL